MNSARPDLFLARGPAPGRACGCPCGLRMWARARLRVLRPPARHRAREAAL